MKKEKEALGKRMSPTFDAKDRPKERVCLTEWHRKALFNELLLRGDPRGAVSPPTGHPAHLSPYDWLPCGYPDWLPCLRRSVCHVSATSSSDHISCTIDYSFMSDNALRCRTNEPTAHLCRIGHPFLQFMRRLLAAVRAV